MRRWLLLGALSALVLAGCSWTQSRFGPAQTGFNPETTITPTNVGSLTNDFFGVVPNGTPLARNFQLFEPTSTNVSVIDARGQHNCSGSPRHCTPLWQTDSAPGNGGIAIAKATLAVL